MVESAPQRRSAANPTCTTRTKGANLISQLKKMIRNFHGANWGRTFRFHCE